MPESDARELLTAYGLPVIRAETARTEAEASAIGRDVGYPLIMKVYSPDISHKTVPWGSPHEAIACPREKAGVYIQRVLGSSDDEPVMRF